MMLSQFASSSLVGFGSDCFWAGFAGLCGFLASAAAVNVAAMIRVPINALRLQRSTRDLELILSPVVKRLCGGLRASKLREPMVAINDRPGARSAPRACPEPCHGIGPK